MVLVTTVIEEVKTLAILVIMVSAVVCIIADLISVYYSLRNDNKINLANFPNIQYNIGLVASAA